MIVPLSVDIGTSDPEAPTHTLTDMSKPSSRSKLRGIISVSVGAALLLTAIGSYLWWSYSALANPETASSDQLCRWLALTKISDHPTETQDKLVDRFCELIRSGELSAEENAIPSFAAETVAQNVEFLQQRWFRSRTTSYDSVPESQQLNYLSENIQVISQWAAMEATPDESSENAASVFDRLESWIDTTPAEHATVTHRALADATVCWLACDDLSELMTEMRSEFAEQLAQALDEGNRRSDLYSALDDNQRTQFRQNAELLAKDWFTSQAIAFDRLPTSEQSKFAMQQVKRVMSWDLAGILLDDSAGSSNPMLVAMQLKLMTGRWVATAGADHKRQLQAFVTAVESQMLKQMMR